MNLILPTSYYIQTYNMYYIFTDFLILTRYSHLKIISCILDFVQFKINFSIIYRFVSVGIFHINTITTINFVILFPTLNSEHIFDINTNKVVEKFN